MLPFFKNQFKFFVNCKTLGFFVLKPLDQNPDADSLKSLNPDPASNEQNKPTEEKKELQTENVKPLNNI
jgi:hypothetical protein